MLYLASYCRAKQESQNVPTSSLEREATEAMVGLVLAFRNRILTPRHSAVGGEAHNSPMLA